MAKILSSFCLLFAFAFADDDGAFGVVSFAKMKSEGVVLQNYEESCGAAALATLMGLFGVKKSEKDILDKVHKTDMLNFEQLSSIATELGFKAKGYKIDVNSFEKLTFPVIAKIEREKEFPHFVVAINHTGGFVTLLDPNFGRYLAPKTEFYDLWSENKKGYILVVLPQSKILNTGFITPQLPETLFLMK